MRDVFRNWALRKVPPAPSGYDNRAFLEAVRFLRRLIEKEKTSLAATREENRG